jgi:hypothetical protein
MSLALVRLVLFMMAGAIPVALAALIESKRRLEKQTKPEPVINIYPVYPGDNPNA